MRRYNYLVGFVGESQCVYGKDKVDPNYQEKVAGLVHPMTIYQAIRQLKTLSSTSKKTIFKLVEVDPKKEKFKRKIITQMIKK